MAPLPFPAAEFLADAGVRVALHRKDNEAVVALLLMACAGWEAKSERGTFPDDAERIAAIIGLSADVVTRAVDFWIVEGWIKREPGSIYLPFVTKLAAEQEAKGEANTERATNAAVVRWDKSANRTLFASQSHAISMDVDDWPKQYTKWACDVWNARFGTGSAPGQEIAGHFGPLKRAGASWAEVSESWQRYVQFCDPKWVKPGHWRPKWRNWLSTSPDIDERSLDIAQSLDKQIRHGDFEQVVAIARKVGRE